MDNDVYILTQKNFGYALREFKYLLVLFYDPECPHCQDFMPIYGKTATLLKSENFVFTKIDCVKNQKIEENYEIEAFPTLMLLIGENRIIYEGKRNSEDIKQWLEEKTKPKFTEINTKKELDEFTKNNLCLVYFGNNEITINNIIIAERKFETMPLGIVSNEELIKEQSPKDKEYKEYINIYKNFDDKRNTLKENLSHENIYLFVNTYYLPKIIEFTDKTSPIIFAKRQPSLVVFSSESVSGNDNAKYLDILNEIWPKIKYKIKLFTCFNKGFMASRLAEYCGVTEDNIPKVFIVQAENETPKKYEMKEEINKENIMNFINKWSEGKLEPYIRSEPIPEKNEIGLVKLVGKNFKKEVIENEKDIFIYFVSPKCIRCQNFEPELNKLAKKLMKNNKNLVMAKMDAVLNDIDELQIHTFPTIVFYPGNAKNKEPLEMKGRKNNIEAIKKFIVTNAYNLIKEEEEEEKNSEL